MKKRATGYLLPGPSTAMHSDLQQAFSGSILSLHFDFDRDGEIFHSGIEFHVVRAFEFTAEPHCTRWQIEDAYDALVEIDESDWVARLFSASEPDKWKAAADAHHYMMYVDSVGCFEIVAESWRPLPEKRGALMSGSANRSQSAQ